jgi:Trypsin-like peptidase domain
VPSVIAAAQRLFSSRVAAWTIAGIASVVALVAIAVAFVLPGTTVTVSPEAASFDGVPQVGALFEGTWRSTPHFCSAVVVDSPSGDVIATAAHCLSGDAKDLEFVPMYHDGQAPYGAWDVTGAYVSQRWLSDQDPQADFAFLTVSPQDTGGTQHTVQSAVGGDQLATESRPPQWTVVIGYPAGMGGQPIICLNQTIARQGYPSLKCGGFVNGTSGGPWLADYDFQTGQGKLYGVTGGRHQGGCVSWVSYSSSFDADTMAVYQRAAADEQPDTVPSATSATC